MKKLFTLFTLLTLSITQLHATDQKELAPVGLTDMPAEVVVHIASFADPQTVHNLSLTCKEFYDSGLLHEEVERQLAEKMCASRGGVDTKGRFLHELYITSAFKSLPDFRTSGFKVRDFMNKAVYDYMSYKYKVASEYEENPMLQVFMALGIQDTNPYVQHLPLLFAAGCMGSNLAMRQCVLFVMSRGNSIGDLGGPAEVISAYLKKNKNTVENLSRWDASRRAVPVSQSPQAERILSFFALKPGKAPDWQKTNSTLTSIAYLPKGVNKLLVDTKSYLEQEDTDLTEQALDEINHLVSFIKTIKSGQSRLKEQATVSDFPSVCLLKAAMLRQSDRMKYLYSCLDEHFSFEISYALLEDLKTTIKWQPIQRPSAAPDSQTLEKTLQSAKRIRQLMAISELAAFSNPLSKEVLDLQYGINYGLSQRNLWPDQTLNHLPMEYQAREFALKMSFFVIRQKVFENMKI